MGESVPLGRKSESVSWEIDFFLLLSLQIGNSRVEILRNSPPSRKCLHDVFGRRRAELSFLQNSNRKIRSALCVVFATHKLNLI